MSSWSGRWNQDDHPNHSAKSLQNLNTTHRSFVASWHLAEGANYLAPHRKELAPSVVSCVEDHDVRSQLGLEHWRRCPVCRLNCLCHLGCMFEPNSGSRLLSVHARPDTCNGVDSLCAVSRPGVPQKSNKCEIAKNLPNFLSHPASFRVRRKVRANVRASTFQRFFRFS